MTTVTINILQKLSTVAAAATLASAAVVTSASSASAVNLVQNGDFSAGNIAFTSQYNYVAPPLDQKSLYPEAAYTIAGNPNITHDNWASFGDHTTGDGNMMIVNGAGAPDVVVWEQVISVTPKMLYNFGAWLVSSYSVSPAVLQFEINGRAIGPVFNASSNEGAWNFFGTTWNSRGAKFARIAIVNQNTALDGNDFALDDITFTANRPVESVPEPITIIGTVIAGGFVGAMKRKQKQASKAAV
jgi:hypothetical protein